MCQQTILYYCLILILTFSYLNFLTFLTLFRNVCFLPIINFNVVAKNTTEMFKDENFFYWKSYLVVFFVKNIFTEFHVLKNYGDNVNQMN